MSKVSNKTAAVLVLGMHRSGTSALTAALQGLGASLGGALVAANDDNPGGYFENATAVTVHETLLAELDRGWEDLRELPEGWLQSPSAQRAASAIAALLRDEFADAPLLAIKDPRLCRLLPLWQPALAKANIEAKYMLVLRHPDEVAASLGKRDGIAADHAHLLWLRYFLDAERDSRGGRRCLLTYEALLADPVSRLRQAGEVLGIEWPQPPSEHVLASILDPLQRHHHPLPEMPAEGPRKLALELYSRAATGAWPDGDAQHALLRDWIRRFSPWLDGTANALARARRDSMRAMQGCRDAQEALERAKSLSFDRLEELRRLNARLQSTDDALEEAKSLSRSRLGELQALNARLQSTDAALEEAKSLSLSRLDEVQALHARLQSTDAALEEAKSLSLSRLDEVQALHARLQSTDAALEEAKSLSLSRLGELQALDARLQSTDAALEETKSLSLSRLEQLQWQEARIGEWQQQLEQRARLLEESVARAERAETDVARMRASHSWRLTAPLRWLARRLGRGAAP